MHLHFYGSSRYDVRIKHACRLAPQCVALQVCFCRSTLSYYCGATAVERQQKALVTVFKRRVATCLPKRHLRRVPCSGYTTSNKNTPKKRMAETEQRVTASQNTQHGRCTHATILQAALCRCHCRNGTDGCDKPPELTSGR